MINDSLSFRISPAQEPHLRSKLKTLGFTFSLTDHAFWRARKGQHTVTFYHAGTILLQGRHSTKMASYLISIGVISAPTHPNATQWVGTDESGKGDYFGPLTVAAVLVKKEIEDNLIQMGVKDSKSLSDPTVKALADKIKALCPHATAVFKLPEYNTFYERIGNLNRILGIGHARVITNILKDHSADYVICDKFGEDKHIINAIPPHLRKLRIIQRTHAENDTAVAAASILARDEYLGRLEALSAKFSLTLSPGASQKVIDVGREFISKHGPDKLKEVAKLHFVTTQHILNPEMVREEQLIDFTPEDFELEAR